MFSSLIAKFQIERFLYNCEELTYWWRNKSADRTIIGKIRLGCQRRRTGPRARRYAAAWVRDPRAYLYGVQRVHYAMLHHPRYRSGGHVRDGALGRKGFIVLKVHNTHKILTLITK